MHFFTSINNNYLPKARVLANSLKKHCSDVRFSLVLCDNIPENFRLENEPFDEVITIDELGVPVKNLKQWIFIHTVVELCTAVKGQSLLKFLDEGSDKVVYLDPDIAVFDNLLELENLLDQYDVILTPHLAHPEKNNKELILDNEVCSLMHGAFNFGFFAVKHSENGLAFAKWWRDRLVDFCFDDIPHGLFTDQKWGDLVPGLFEGVYVLRDPSYNVATWNINNRKVSMTSDSKYTVNGIPLKFYHFSGFDSGSQEGMLQKYGEQNPALWSLRDWYIDQMNEAGQNEFGGMPSIYSKYDNGQVITNNERMLLRSRNDLLEYYSDCDPFITNKSMHKNYYQWYKEEQVRLEIESKNDKQIEADLRKRCDDLQLELQLVYNSTSWKLTKVVRKSKDLIRKIIRK
jgi:hypothetical protein